MAVAKYIRFPFYVSRSFGFSNARNDAAKHFGASGLMVQFNDDLILSPAIWSFLGTIKPGEFGFQMVKNWVCSRVFVIHLEDFWRVGGFNPKIKFYFEDGDFYKRAVAAGLKFRIVSDDLAKHIPHTHAYYRPRYWIGSESEACKMFVQHGQDFVSFNRIVDDFLVPWRDYRVAFHHLVLRIFFLWYWITRRALSL